MLGTCETVHSDVTLRGNTDGQEVESFPWEKQSQFPKGLTLLPQANNS